MCGIFPIAQKNYLIMEKVKRLTIAISAYNEGKNIKNFLMSVLSQKEEGFKLDNIWVYSDGSTDNTERQVKSIKSPKIVLFSDKKRVGKSSRLNQIYKNLKSDILVQSDADVIFSHPYVIRDLITPLLKDDKVGMTGGNPLPFQGVTWLEKAINYTCEAYNYFRYNVRGGNNVFSADGRLLAYRKELVTKIKVPLDMIANDAYTYYCCLTHNYKYKFAPQAVVNYRSPQNLKDHIKQNTRFLAAPIRMSKYFNPSLIKYETSIPTFIKIKSFLSVFIRHPLSTFLIFIINKYCLILAKMNEAKMNAKWEMAMSTKITT